MVFRGGCRETSAFCDCQTVGHPEVWFHTGPRIAGRQGEAGVAIFMPGVYPPSLAVDVVGAHPSCGHGGQMHLPPAACMARRWSTIAEVGDQYRKGRWQCIAKLSGTPLPFREGIVTRSA